MKKLLVLLFFMLIVLTGCGNKDDSSSSSAKAGDPEKLYNQKCSICHGSNLEGGGGPKLDAVGSELSKEDIEKIILEGKGTMPKGVLKGEDAKAVAEWLSEKK
ncbi:MAG: cytochrome c551 [Bacillus sp. (in: firmicutes)]